MAESEARDWVLVWVEDLHRRAGRKRFWEEEQERIDLGTLHQGASPRYQQGCTACFTKKQRDLSILMPL